MKFTHFFSPFIFRNILLMCVLSLFSFTSLAQVSCGGQSVTSCKKFPTQTYQCIDGDFNASGLYGTKLLNATQALTTPQFILVKGKVTFTSDYTFAAGSDIVFLDNNSGFKVASFAKLTLISSGLHGCTRLWAGVEVVSNGKIVAQNCTFEDAKAAIILRSQSYSEITGNTFKKNVCGILCVSLSQGFDASIILLSRKGISGNTFLGNHQLLETITPESIDPGITQGQFDFGSTNFPNVGIWLDRVTSLSIGFQSNSSGSQINSFLNFGKNQELAVHIDGIRSMFSNVNISNCTFGNFGIYDVTNTANNVEATAIYAVNSGNIPKQTTITGVNNTSTFSPLNTFSNCYQDIHTRGTSLTVTDVTSYKSGNSIRALTQASYFHSITVKVLNNKIDYFRSIAIDIEINRDITCNIENNQIYDNDELNDVPKRVGIRIGQIPGTPDPTISLKGSRIFNNKIRSRSKLLNGVFWGIVLRKVSYLTIEQNQIVDELEQTNLSAFYGIRVDASPCNGIRFYSNIITGGKINYLDELGVGIFINESVNCILNCNETSKTNAGIVFTGMCNNADFSKNKFNLHKKGLACGYVSPFNTFGSIGLQIAKENRWLGTNSTIEAFAGDLSSAQSSVFEINSSNLGSDYWPSPRKIGTDDDNLIWFMPLTGQEPSNNFGCLSTPPLVTSSEGLLAQSDIKLLSNSYQPPKNFTALSWEAKFQFADRLNRNPALQAIDSNTSQYFQNTYNESFSKMNRIYQGYLNRWQPESILTANASVNNSTLKAAIEQRFALDILLSENSADNSILYTQMITSDAAIVLASVNLKVANENLNALVTQNVNQLITSLSEVTCIEPYELDMKTVLNTMLQSHVSNGVTKAEEKAKMADIASKCRYSGGYAVVLARGFFDPKDCYKQDEVCEGKERSEIGKPELTRKAFVYPNPVNQILNIQLDQIFEKGNAKVFNSQGTLLRIVEIFEQNSAISVDNLPNGTYYLEINTDNKKSIHKLFVVVH
jgi:hypothetical protein